MKPKQDLPSDFDLKFAEQTIKKMGKELATGASMGLIAAVCLYAPLIKGM
jgi:hypothetical protein